MNQILLYSMIKQILNKTLTSCTGIFFESFHPYNTNIHPKYTWSKISVNKNYHENLQVHTESAKQHVKIIRALKQRQTFKFASQFCNLLAMEIGQFNFSESYSLIIYLEILLPLLQFLTSSMGEKAFNRCLFSFTQKSL